MSAPPLKPEVIDELISSSDLNGRSSTQATVLLEHQYIDASRGILFHDGENFIFFEKVLRQL